MTLLLKLIVSMAIVTWLLLVVASMIRVRGWTLQGTLLALGNRDNLPTPSLLAGRAERAARNTLENFVLFAALALVAQAAGMANERVLLGAQVFFWARIVYIPVYLAGLTYLRTAVWIVSLAGLGLMIVGLY